MSRWAVLAGALWASGCLGLGMRSSLDDGSGQHTEVEVRSALPGAQVAVDGIPATLDTTGNATLTIQPALDAHGTALRISRGGANVDLPLNWARDYEVLEIPRSEPLAATTILVMRAADGSCVAGHTDDELWGGTAFSGEYVTAVETCGPWLAP